MSGISIVTCDVCGHQWEMSLPDGEWCCPECGAELSPAENLKLTIRPAGSGSGAAVTEFHCPKCAKILRPEGVAPGAEGTCPDCGELYTAPMAGAGTRAPLKPGEEGLDKKMVGRAQCDICLKKMAKGRGYVLTTRQVVTEPGYWAFAFRGAGQAAPSMPEVVVQNMFEQQIRQQCSQFTGWLTCESCISKFPDVDRERAQAFASEYWEHQGAGDFAPPDGDAVEPALALAAAETGWKQVTGMAAPETTIFVSSLTAKGPLPTAQSSKNRSLTIAAKPAGPTSKEILAQALASISARAWAETELPHVALVRAIAESTSQRMAKVKAVLEARAQKRWQKALAAWERQMEQWQKEEQERREKELEKIKDEQMMAMARQAVADVMGVQLPAKAPSKPDSEPVKERPAKPSKPSAGDPNEVIARENAKAWQEWREAHPEPIDLRGADLSGLPIFGLDLKGADLRDVRLERVHLAHCDLSGANLTNAIADSTAIDNCSFRRADLSGARFREASFSYVTANEGTDLTGASFVGASFSPTGSQNTFAQQMSKKQQKEAGNPQKECFVATACYGSADCAEVIALRHFRDQYLMLTRLGRWIVKCYYHLSPPCAAVVRSHPLLRRAVKACIVHPLAVLASATIVGVSSGSRSRTGRRDPSDGHKDRGTGTTPTGRPRGRCD